MLDTAAVDRDRKFLLNSQVCNPYREEGIVLSLLAFTLCKRKESGGIEMVTDFYTRFFLLVVPWGSAEYSNHKITISFNMRNYGYFSTVPCKSLSIYIHF